MALQTSGAISLSDINVELNLSATATISLNDSAVRGLFGKASGVISLSDGYGKASEIVYINTFDRTAASIFELMGSPTQPGIYIFENQATISAGTGSYALRTGVFPAGSTLRIVNKGYIRGRGGNGGANTGAAGTAGASALYIDMNCILDNGAGYIFGGGGGGGGARRIGNSGAQYWVGAGGGGGAGVSGGASGGDNGNTFGGTLAYTIEYNTAAQAGTADAGGSGGRFRQSAGNSYADVIGGSGGGLGTAGGPGTSSHSGSLKDATALGAGGAAGAAITRNGNTVSIIAGNNTTQIKGAIV